MLARHTGRGTGFVLAGSKRPTHSRGDASPRLKPPGSFPTRTHREQIAAAVALALLTACESSDAGDATGQTPECEVYIACLGALMSTDAVELRRIGRINGIRNCHSRSKVPDHILPLPPVARVASGKPRRPTGGVRWQCLREGSYPSGRKRQALGSNSHTKKRERLGHWPRFSAAYTGLREVRTLHATDDVVSNLQTQLTHRTTGGKCPELTDATPVSQSA